MTATVYRYFGEDGALLYVGMSSQPALRHRQHLEHGKPWWYEVTGATFEHHPTREDAETAERNAIIHEHPRYNVERLPPREHTPTEPREWPAVDLAAGDPVGAVEIAARLNVKRRTVDQWRQRGLSFPEPRWTVGGRPAWNMDDVEAWAEARRVVHPSTVTAVTR